MKGYVLYVDDDASNLAVFRAALSDALPLLTAGGGREALELLGQHEVAVLLTDQRMPGMTGVELMQQVRERWPDTARMLVTAYSDIDEAAAAINRGQVHHYVRKPWEPAALKALLEGARDNWLLKRQVDALQVHLRETERVYSLGVVAASVAHDLRGPLFAMDLELEALKLHLGREAGGVSESAQRSIDAVREGLGTIKGIASSLEVTTRRRADGDVDLRQVVELALRNVRTLVMHRGELEVALEPVSHVRGDATRLGQVVMNLLVNAALALPESEDGQLRGLVRVTLFEEGGRAVLAVRDTGVGIAPKDLERIFDPFFTTREEGGAGLGLAISRSIVEECGGALTVNSVVGGGSTFTVTLPTRPA